MRLEVSRRADLATRALLVLGEMGRRAKSPELAERVGTTPGFLSQAMAPLIARGWVRSDPGPTGGYSAAVSLDRVSVLEVIEAVEGPSDAGRCVLEDRPCNGAGPCALHVAWSRARGQLLGELANTSLASLASGRDTR
jgi:Rrf2 family iron-sulfur cluster assembly transcriptional regulator